MFDDRDDPQHLLQSLEKFFRIFGIAGSNLAGITEEKLLEVDLPQPLKTLYGLVGNWPGDNWFCSRFANQDVLVPFELLSMREGRVAFAWENQGCWSCGTLPTGNDPPVWVSVDGGPWNSLCDSLAQFLVSLCLQESLFGCRFIGRNQNLIDMARSKGNQVTPLWIDGPFVNADGLTTHSFHVIDGKILVMDDFWCGTENEKAAQWFPELLKPTPEPNSVNVEQIDWNDRSMSVPLKETLLRFAIRKHQRLADVHGKKATAYRRILSGFEAQ